MPAAPRTATVQYQPSGHDFRVIIRVGARHQVFATVVGSVEAVRDELVHWHVAGADATEIPAAG